MLVYSDMVRDGLDGPFDWVVGEFFLRCDCNEWFYYSWWRCGFKYELSCWIDRECLVSKLYMVQ